MKEFNLEFHTIFGEIFNLPVSVQVFENKNSKNVFHKITSMYIYIYILTDLGE